MLLARMDGGEFALIPATGLIGRDRHCDLVLRSEHASARHAEIRCRPGGWDVRDLGSRNGTSVDGARLAPGVLAPLRAGAILQFAAPDERWRVEALLAPEPCLFDRQTGARLTASDGRMGPLVYDLELDRWTLAGGLVQHGERVGDLWAFLPEAGHLESTVPSPVDLEGSRLRLVASADLARIDVHVEGVTERVSFLERSWSIALYVLALERASEPDAGWMEVERLARRTGLERKVLDVYLIRAREAFVRAGIGRGERVVEVRRGARRLGIRDVRIEQANS